MPRGRRPTPGGYCYHVLDRGNGRAEVSHEAGDFAAFLRIMGEAALRHPLRLLAYCLMPNTTTWPSGSRPTATCRAGCTGC